MILLSADGLRGVGRKARVSESANEIPKRRTDAQALSATEAAGWREIWGSTTLGFISRVIARSGSSLRERSSVRDLIAETTTLPECNQCAHVA